MIGLDSDPYSLIVTYFAGFNFRDLAKKYVKNVKNTLKTLKIRFPGSLISRFFENRENREN